MIGNWVQKRCWSPLALCKQPNRTLSSQGPRPFQPPAKGVMLTWGLWGRVSLRETQALQGCLARVAMLPRPCGAEVVIYLCLQCREWAISGVQSKHKAPRLCNTSSLESKDSVHWTVPWRTRFAMASLKIASFFPISRPPPSFGPSCFPIQTCLPTCSSPSLQSAVHSQGELCKTPTGMWASLTLKLWPAVLCPVQVRVQLRGLP